MAEIKIIRGEYLNDFDYDNEVIKYALPNGKSGVITNPNLTDDEVIEMLTDANELTELITEKTEYWNGQVRREIKVMENGKLTKYAVVLPDTATEKEIQAKMNEILNHYRKKEDK